jgi:hypothetical protein
MPRNTIDEMIEILQAYKEGKTLECRESFFDKAVWKTVIEPVFSFHNTEYRIKKEPPKKKKLYQFLCQNMGDKRYFVTANMMENAFQCYETNSHCTVIKRLDHTMIEVEG